MEQPKDQNIHIGKALAEAVSDVLGLKGKLVNTITITIDPDDVSTIDVRFYVGELLEQALIDQLAALSADRQAIIIEEYPAFAQVDAILRSFGQPGLPTKKYRLVEVE